MPWGPGASCFGVNPETAGEKSPEKNGTQCGTVGQERGVEDERGSLERAPGLEGGGVRVLAREEKEESSGGGMGGCSVERFGAGLAQGYVDCAKLATIAKSWRKRGDYCSDETMSG